MLPLPPGISTGEEKSGAGDAVWTPSICGRLHTAFAPSTHDQYEATLGSEIQARAAYNIFLRAHLEHSESWRFEDRQMGAGELARAHKASCFKQVVSNQQDILRVLRSENHGGDAIQRHRDIAT